jgi:hypothetical protein
VPDRCRQPPQDDQPEPGDPNATSPDATGCASEPDLPVLPEWFACADEEHLRREKARARDLRSSQWWKNQCASGRCHYCGAAVRPRDLTMDHKVPIVRGGRSTRHNVVPCCKSCNDSKRYLLPSEWDAHLARLRAAPRHVSPDPRRPDDPTP